MGDPGLVWVLGRLMPSGELVERSREVVPVLPAAWALVPESVGVALVRSNDEATSSHRIARRLGFGLLLEHPVAVLRWQGLIRMTLHMGRANAF